MRASSNCSHNHDKNITETLIKAGANVNYSNGKGRTALMGASCPNCVKTLVVAGADVNMIDNDGNTALMLASGTDHYKCVNELLKSGADVNIIDKEGKTALCNAARIGRDKCVNSLLKGGADVNMIDNVGNTALMLASRSNHYKSVNELLKSGADVNSGKNNEGYTALQIASHYGYYECIDLLLEAGADVNITDDYGGNALHINEGRYSGHMSTCMKRLLRAGIHINKFSKPKGKNAIQTILVIKKYYRDPDLDLYAIGYKDALKLLYAAGEKLDKIPEEIKFEEEKLQLKHICRETIRKHLLKLDLHSNLFGRIPELGLPSIMTEYLLFNQSLDNDDDDDNDDDEDDDIDDEKKVCKKVHKGR